MHLLRKIVVTIHIFLSNCVIKVQPFHGCNLVSDDQKQCFVKDLLLSADHNSNQVTVDKSDTLYFSFDAGQGEFNPAMLNIETKKLKLLKGVKDAYAIASNKSSGEVYFGGSNGIYKYVPANRKLMRLQYRTLDVYWLFIQKDIFCVQFPRLTAYMYAKKEIRPLEKIETSSVHRFVFDNQNTIIFINGSGLFKVRENEDRPVLLTKSPTFLGLAVDNRGKVYACSDDGIYVVKSDSVYEKVSRLVSVRGVLAMTFDKKNHLIYSDARDLVRLLPMQKRRISPDSLLKPKPNEFKSVNVCHKACKVLKMLNH